MNYYKIALGITLIAIEILALTPNTIKLVESKFNSSGAVEHILAFIVLYVLLYLSCNGFSMLHKIVLLFLFAMQIEVAQYFVPSRSVNIWDIAADMFGVVLIILLWIGIKYFLQYMQNKQ